MDGGLGLNGCIEREMGLMGRIDWWIGEFDWAIEVFFETLVFFIQKRENLRANLSGQASCVLSICIILACKQVALNLSPSSSSLSSSLNRTIELWKKLRDGIFGNFFRLQSVKFYGKLIHCILLSEIVNNDPDSIAFKVFDHEIKFTRDAFYIITGLKCYSSPDIKGLHEKENRLSKVYFPGKDRVELGDLFNFITSHPHGTTAAFVGSDDDAMKLATIYFVQSVLMGKWKNMNVSEQIMKIVDDDELCSSFNWGSLSYETLLKSLKSYLKPNENETEKEKDKDNYTILGFPFAFCVWIIEVIPIFQEKQFVNFQESSYPQMLCYSEMKSPQFDSLCKKYFHNENLYKLIEVSPFIPVEEDTKPLSVDEPISQDESSMPSSTQFDEAMLKEIVKRLSESFKKDLQAEVTRINHKIAFLSHDLKKTLGSKLDTLLKIYGKPDERNIEKESSVPITKDGVDDHCHDTEPTIAINKDAGGDERDNMDMHAEVLYERDFRYAHLDDETENVTDIGKEFIDGVEVQDVGECQNQENSKETGVTEKICKCGWQSQEDLESSLGTSVSEIVCKCLEGTYDLSTPLSYKEKFRVQTCANQDGTYNLPTPPSLTDNIGTKENASEDNDVIGMILTIANESCELANKEHGEQLQDKENVQLEDKENDASNILAELSLEKTQEGSVNKTKKNNDEDPNQYTRKRKRDSICYDGPSFSIRTPTPPSTQMSIDGGLPLEVEGNVEEELGLFKRNKKLSWQLKSPFDQERKKGISMTDNQNTPKISGWIKSTYTRRCIFHYATDDAKLLKKFIVWLGKEKRRGHKKEGQTDIYADDNGVRKNPYKLYHQKISSKMFFLELSDSSFVLDDKHIDIALYYLRKKECYHPRDHPFRCTTTDILFDNYIVLVYKDFSEDSTHEFWCAGDNQLFLTPYVGGGDSRRCGIAWTEVDKIFFPCRLSLEDDNVVIHFLLGVLDLNQKKIDASQCLQEDQMSMSGTQEHGIALAV
ncbi:uncharacterized protein [Nicotiana sylvestris]|uniref:uncharacterized protein n=1 Tax=Nicotiana sylvestris TaxID=4096 RepID=UPI00388C34C2